MGDRPDTASFLDASAFVVSNYFGHALETRFVLVPSIEGHSPANRRTIAGLSIGVLEQGPSFKSKVGMNLLRSASAMELLTRDL